MKCSAVYFQEGLVLTYSFQGVIYGTINNLVSQSVGFSIASGTWPRLLIDGTLLRLFYINQSGSVVSSESTDGVTWSVPTSLGFTATAIDVIILSSGYIGVFVANSGGVYRYSEEDGYTASTQIVSGATTQVAAAVVDSVEVVAYSGSDHVLNVRSGSSTSQYSDVVSFDILNLPTGHLLLIYDIGFNLQGVVSLDRGETFQDSWTQLTMNSATDPELLVVSVGTNFDDLYVIGTVLDAQTTGTLEELRIAYVDLFVYLSESLDVGFVPTLFP